MWRIRCGECAAPFTFEEQDLSKGWFGELCVRCPKCQAILQFFCKKEELDKHLEKGDSNF